MVTVEGRRVAMSRDCSTSSKRPIELVKQAERKASSLITVVVTTVSLEKTAK